MIFTTSAPTPAILPSETPAITELSFESATCRDEEAGLLGLFYGPVIMLLLVTTVQIYSERYARVDVEVIQDNITKDAVTEQSDMN